MPILHLLYPFICQQTFRLLSCLDYCKQCYYEHWVACILSIHVFLWIYAQEQVFWITWKLQFEFLNETPYSSQSVQFRSITQSCLTFCDPMNHSTPGLPVHCKLPEFTQTMSIESVMPSSHLILCRPLLLHTVFINFPSAMYEDSLFFIPS